MLAATFLGERGLLQSPTGTGRRDVQQHLLPGTSTQLGKNPTRHSPFLQEPSISLSIFSEKTF